MQNYLEGVSMKLRAMTWNIKAGGCADYGQLPDLAERPPREAAIKEVVDNYRNAGVSIMVLVDVYGWSEIYGDDAGIAHHLGFTSAHYTRLCDPRFGLVGRSLGVVIATNHEIVRFRTIDLGMRYCAAAVLKIGSHQFLQCVGVYLDDLSEEVRENQARNLVNQLEPNIPTVLMGDFNTLRPSLRGASVRHLLGDFAVRTVAATPSVHKLITSIKGMNNRRVVPLLRSFGFADGDGVAMQPTAPAFLPCFGIDYVFSRNGVKVLDCQVAKWLDIHGASDHLPLSFVIEI